MDKPQIILHSQKSVNYTVFDVKWIPTSAKFIALGNHARGTGALDIFEITHGDITLVSQVGAYGHENADEHQKVRSLPARETVGVQMRNIRCVADASETTSSNGKLRWIRSSLVEEFTCAGRRALIACSSSRRDIEKLNQPIYSAKGHKEIINAIDGVGGLGIGEGAPEIATASRDGTSRH